ncbi:MAG: DUF4367 domain-containing protein [Lachnospiraceae bacterium]|nr:DUF4367 domain-containing protein [Lachnospiraceae bacterium]
MDKNEAGCHSQKYTQGTFINAQAPHGMPKYKSIEQLIKDAYGLNQKNMIKRMEWAEQEAESDTPLAGQEIPSPPKDEFQVILAKMEVRGITPRKLEDFNEEEKEAFQREGILNEKQLTAEGAEETFEEHGVENAERRNGSKLRFLRHPLKTAGVIAAAMAVTVAVIGLNPNIDVLAMRPFKYISEVREGKKTDIVWNNQEDIISEKSSLEKTFDQVKEELKMPVLKINYIPEGMKLSTVVIEDGHARLEFEYGNNCLYMYEVSLLKSNSNAVFSDCEKYTSVFNEWINKEIPIRKSKIEDGRIEYIAYTQMENAHYYFCGIMEEEEFCNIICNLTLEK